MDRVTNRRVRRTLGALLVASTLLPAASAAQPTQVVAPKPPGVLGQPPRDRVPPPRAGTGVVRGRVVDGITGRAIARARVRLVSGPNAAKAPVQTDAGGAFEFTALPAGMYSLQVEKSSYLSARHPESGRTLRARVQPLFMVDAGIVDDLVIPMFHGGAIAGRVVDAYGDPVENAQIRVMRPTRGGGRPTMAGQSQSNDVGEFRVPRLQAGRYIVQVQPQMNQGNYPEPPVPEAPLPQPLPTYYPNVLEQAQAQPITVNHGETVSGVEMTLAEGVPTLLAGTVVRADGEVVNGGSVMARLAGPEAVGGFIMGGSAGLRPGGTFRLLLAPGEYTLQAESMKRQGPGTFGPENQLSGTLRVSVGGGTVDAVTIMLGGGATASGKVVFEGTTPPPPSPGQTRVPLFNPEGRCNAGQATIAADWTFTVESLSGTCSAPPTRLFGRWMLKSVTLKGADLLDQPVTFEPGQQYNNIQVVVTDKRTLMDLRVSGDDGLPTREYVALAFPLEKTKWDPQLRQVRTFVPPTNMMMPASGTGMAGPPGAAGATVRQGVSMPQERFLGLPPGEYYVIAVDDIEAEDSQDPAVLERLTSNAIRVVLTDDGPIEVPLRRVNMAEVLR